MRIVAHLTRTKVIYAAAVLAVVFASLPQAIAPDGTVTTLNATRKPLTGITVREAWQQYSLEDSSHEEDRSTDIRGEVHFPRLASRAVLLRR